MFNITQIGNRVDIESEGVDFTITKHYLTGTYLPIADIVADGWNWDVTYSGGFVANVKLSGGLLQTAGTSINSSFNKALYGSWTGRQTLNDVTLLSPTIMWYAADPWSSDEQWFEMTKKHVFMACMGSDDFGFIVKRYSIENTTTITYNPNSASHWLMRFCLYDDTTIYTLEQDANDDKIYVYKLTFTEYGYESLEIGNWSTSTTFDGRNYNYGGDVFFGIVKYGVYDKLVSIQYYEWAEDSRQVILHYANYDTFSGWDSAIFKEAFDYHINVNLGLSEHLVPAIYQTKIVWGLQVDSLDAGDLPPESAIPQVGIYIYDLVDNSVTNLYIYSDNWDVVYYFSFISSSSAIDYSTGKFYFFLYMDDYDANVYEQYLYELNLLDNSISHSDNKGSTKKYDMNQGIKPFALDVTTIPGNCNVYSIPDWDIKAIIPVINASNIYRMEGSYVIDNNKGLIWTATDTGLSGKRIWGSESERDITISWGSGDGTVPWDYASEREMWFRILDGMAVMMIASAQLVDPVHRQRDFYLLME